MLPRKPYPYDTPEGLVEDALRIAQEYLRRKRVSLLTAGVDLEDAESAAFIGAWCACTRWDPTQGGWHATVIYHIDRSVREVSRHYGRLRIPEYRAFLSSVRSLDEPTSQNRGEDGQCTSCLVQDMVADPADEFEDRCVYRLLLQEAMAKLPDQERFVIEEHFVNGETYREIAVKLGVSPRTVYTVKQRAIKKLRQELAEHLP